MTVLQGNTKIAFLCFFISHIPITLLIDGQAFFPRHYYPQILQDVVDWYAITFKDKLMTHPDIQPWFSSLVAIEILFQLPFFFYAVSTMLKRKDINKNLCLVYASSTATTLIPIFACILTDEETTLEEKSVLMSFYLPYLIFPLWLIMIAASEQSALDKKKK